MGMFDQIWVPCPTCGERVEFQSKRGNCVLGSYTIETATPDMLTDIARDVVQCSCGTPVGVQVQVIAWPINRGKFPIPDEPA